MYIATRILAPKGALLTSLSTAALAQGDDAAVRANRARAEALNWVAEDRITRRNMAALLHLVAIARRAQIIGDSFSNGNVIRPLAKLDIVASMK